MSAAQDAERIRELEHRVEAIRLALASSDARDEVRRVLSTMLDDAERALGVLTPHG